MSVPKRQQLCYDWFNLKISNEDSPDEEDIVGNDSDDSEEDHIEVINVLSDTKDTNLLDLYKQEMWKTNKKKFQVTKLMWP